MEKFETFQEFMDWSVQKIVDQGKQCLNEDGECEYADGEGNHCLIGWHLPPNSGAIKSGLTVSTIVKDFPDDCAYFSHFPVFALEVAQSFHDCGNSVSRMSELNVLAQHFGLDTTPSQYSQWIDMGETHESTSG